MVNITITNENGEVMDVMHFSDYVDDAKLDFPNDDGETHYRCAIGEMVEEFERCLKLAVKKVRSKT